MPPALLILDANVLIDFCHTDRTLLTLVDRHVGRVHIASPVLAQVDQMTEEEVGKLGLELVHPEMEMATEAAVRTRGHPLAFDDWICLLMAKARGWTCVTNDKRLRVECASVTVEVLWGLELLGGLAQQGALTPKQAEDAAWEIHRTNPRFVTRAIVEAFCAKVNPRGRRR